VAALIVGAAILIVAVYIMAHGLGLSDSLDFGAGAYYYADIPGFENTDSGTSFVSSVPVWVHILLFLVWGLLMYKLWCWIDKR